VRKAGPIVLVALVVGCGATTRIPDHPADACTDDVALPHDDGGLAPEAAAANDSSDAASEAAADGSDDTNDGASADVRVPDEAAPAGDGSGGGPDDGPAGSDAPSHCDDNVQDFDETDIDCGGSCPGCWLAQHCLNPHDCSPSAPGCNTRLGGCACDAVSLTCVADPCIDHRKDGDESDVDCGGHVCSACGTGKICTSNVDCKNESCDPLTARCAATQCTDQQRDGSETDVDCGGGVCTPCPVGMGCALDYDCTTQACDPVMHKCVADPCFDERQDGTETDIDCGGSVCAARCAVGKTCASTSDCAIGHVCTTSLECL
jgi:hypothetical protein